MTRELQCNVCKKKFYGRKGTMYCSNGCKNEIKRKKRNERSVEKRRKETNRKYYLKTRYLKTEKYKKEQERIEKRKKEYNKEWISNNQIKRAEYRRKSRKKAKGWLDEYKKTLKCEVCGYNRCSGALDFHHKDIKEKKFNIGQSAHKYGKEIILKEIEKCFVLCANCHRELHYEEKYKKVKKQRKEYLELISKPKKIYYSIVEKELEEEWFKELQNRAKYNLNRFGGNQYVRVDNGISEKIDIKKILAKKIGIGEKTICKILQIYRRGTEEQKKRARDGESSVTKIWKELEPIRYNRMVATVRGMVK